VRVEPGIEGLSERITVRSVLGRFLEHSRLYCFEIAGEKSYLMGSADLMARNLDHRIEVLVPVEAAHVRAEIETILRRLETDNVQTWTLDADARWRRIQPSRVHDRARPQAPRCAGTTAAAPDRSKLSAVMWRRHHGAVPIAVIDVGANTARLHVARGSHVIYRERAMLAPGRVDRADRRASPNPSCCETMDTVRCLCPAGSDEHGAGYVEVLVTSPGTPSRPNGGI